MSDAPVVDAQMLPRSVYIHVPFCRHRCGYCDFTLIAKRDDLIEDYLSALDKEISNAQIPNGIVLDSLFFGGGTPTHPQPDQIRRLFQIVRNQFEFSSATEISIEANPLDLTDEKIKVLCGAGVNRISLGVQSFSVDALRLLERDHQPEDILDVVTRLQDHFKNISFDLIFGIPGQTPLDWQRTLRQAIELGPQHISTYGLTFENGTAFWTRRERGQISAIDEECERVQYAMAIDELTASGFKQYEISNFARPGYQCRHNHSYWNGDEYFAFGPGAARYVKGRRETNIRSVLGWLARLERNESLVAEAEELDGPHRAKELIYLGLRRNAGVSRREFLHRTGLILDDVCGEVIRDQTNLGLVKDDGLSIRLTREGRFVADRVIMEFL